MLEIEKTENLSEDAVRISVIQDVSVGDVMVGFEIILNEFTRSSQLEFSRNISNKLLSRFLTINSLASKESKVCTELITDTELRAAVAFRVKENYNQQPDSIYYKCSVNPASLDTKSFAVQSIQRYQ